jgi:hypothetical protein
VLADAAYGNDTEFREEVTKLHQANLAGRGVPDPPPINPASETAWRGTRKGRSAINPVPCGNSPATL